MPKKKPQYRYDIHVEQQSDGWFIVSVPDIPELSIHASNIVDVSSHAAHAIASWLELNPDEIRIDLFR